MNKKGTLYGVGVGPGEPEQLTLKAYRIINENNIIAIPAKEKENTVTYSIVKELFENVDEKVFLNCPVEMTKDIDTLNENYDSITNKLCEYLDDGQNVVFLTIGDPTIYATYMYIHQRIMEKGYTTEIINGIPSFCAAAAKLQISLAERNQELHIIPGSYSLDEALAYPGNKILMKSGSKLANVKNKLKEIDAKVYMVENCGMANEHIYMSADDIDENAGYMSLIIVKE